MAVYCRVRADSVTKEAVMTETNSRSCGGCTACCFTHEIEHFKKSVATQCGQCEAGKGCKIYGQHPDECRGFKCLWLLSAFPENMRPDRLGVVVDFVPEEKVKVKVTVLRMYEVWGGALESAHARALLQGLMIQKCVVILKRLQPGNTYGTELVASPSYEAEYLEEKTKAAP